MLDTRSTPAIIAMVHLKALPGTPGYGGSVQEIIDSALKEAHIYQSCGVDAILIENMHDIPYLNKAVGHEISSIMAIVGSKIKEKTGLPVGLQILAGANKAALAAAHAGSLDFIRAEGFVFGHVADEGWMNADAGELLRYRKTIGAESIKIWADIKKKHASHALTADINLSETAKAAEFFKADALIITGSSTGKEGNIEDFRSVNAASNLPIVAGSGITKANVGQYWPYAKGFIVGSHFKEEGNWMNAVQEETVKAFMRTVESLRK